MSSHPVRLQKADILIVDDEPENLYLLATLLIAQGHVVRKASSGPKALTEAENNPPDIILLDIRMPKMDGYEVCASLKASKKTRDIPVIFLSALEDALDKVKAFNVGASDYITKPFEFEELLVRLANQLLIQHQKKLLNEQNLLLQREICERERLLNERKHMLLALAQANEELERIANIDNLTQIANRRRFDEQFLWEWRRMMREMSPLSLLMCDIDCFKHYNDTYGHLAGDEVLQQVARCIQQNVKRPADLAARYGGEEFTVILPNTTAEGAIQVTEDIHSELHRLNIPHRDCPVSDRITVSIGIACTVPTATASPESLLLTADQALYAAKAEKRKQGAPYVLHRL